MTEPMEVKYGHAATADSEAGFTLVELLVTLAVGSIFMLAVIQLFVSTNEINTVQEQLAGTQQSIRVAMEIMTRDLRMTGLDPVGGNGAGFQTAASDNEDTDSTSVSLRYQYDENGDGADETIDRSYYFDNANERLMLRDGAVYQSLTEDGTISSVTFSYILDDDSVDSDPSGNGNLGRIRVVSIRICGKITGAFENNHPATYCFSNTVRPRNM